MSLEVIQVEPLINRLKVWEEKKAYWLDHQGTSFGTFHQDHYDKVKQARKLKNQK